MLTLALCINAACLRRGGGAEWPKTDGSVHLLHLLSLKHAIVHAPWHAWRSRQIREPCFQATKICLLLLSYWHTTLLSGELVTSGSYNCKWRPTAAVSYFVIMCSTWVHSEIALDSDLTEKLLAPVALPRLKLH